MMMRIRMIPWQCQAGQEQAGNPSERTDAGSRRHQPGWSTGYQWIEWFLFLKKSRIHHKCLNSPDLSHHDLISTEKDRTKLYHLWTIKCTIDEVFFYSIHQLDICCVFHLAYWGRRGEGWQKIFVVRFSRTQQLLGRRSKKKMMKDHLIFIPMHSDIDCPELLRNSSLQLCE